MTPRQGPLRQAIEALRRGEVCAEDLVSSAIRRIEERDREINAVVLLEPERALDQARQQDAQPQQRGLLHGMPALVKDLEDVAGMPTRKGSALLRDAPAAHADSVVPAALRRHGAIILGKTNLPEFATEGFTDNLLSGPTRNPWDARWSPGGSSGGSAAAVAAGMVPIATATDGGGSIRIPASMCGLVGLKPTRGLVGNYPAPDWIDLSTCGPFATTVDDLRLLLHVMMGRVDGDPASAAAPWDVLSPTGRTPTRVIIAERTSPLGPLPEAVRRPLVEAATRFGQLWPVPIMTMEPEEFFPGLGDPDLDWFTLATAEHVHGLGAPWVRASVDQMHPAAAEFMEQGLAVGIDDYLQARRRQYEYTRRLDQLLADGSVLITPTVALDGWSPEGRVESASAIGMLPAEAYSTAVQNVTGHPAITLPAGQHANGLPFGLQVTAGRWQDDLLLDIAHAWEDAFPWPLAAPGYRPFSAE